MVFVFLGGFSKHEAIHTCKRYILSNQHPILNYAVEGNTNYSSIVFQEYMSLLSLHL